MRVARFVVAGLVVGGCATTHVSSARFVSRSPAGGVVATPSAEVGMDDANTMIGAHCGTGGYSITREGEALVGDTVVTEGANSIDAQTTEQSGQVQGHENSKTTYARGSNWHINYTCNDARTVNMGLITRSRTTPSRFAWGADVGGGAMLIAGVPMDGDLDYQVPRNGAATSVAGNAWAGLKLSEAFSIGGGLGMVQVVGMPNWQYSNGGYGERTSDAMALELFATSHYAIAERVDLGVRVGLATWTDVRVDGVTPLASLQLGFRLLDVGPSGVYLSAAISSFFSSELTNNATPALAIGFH